MRDRFCPLIYNIDFRKQMTKYIRKNKSQAIKRGRNRTPLTQAI